MFNETIKIIDGEGNSQELMAFARVDDVLVPGHIQLDYFTFHQLQGNAYTYCEFLELGNGDKKQMLITPPSLLVNDPVMVFYNVQGSKEGKVSFLKDSTNGTPDTVRSFTNLNGLSGNNPNAAIRDISGVTNFDKRIRHGRFGGGKNPSQIVLSTGYIPKNDELLVLEIESEEETNQIAFEIMMFEINGIIDKT